ncbi:efflux transporter outer membrane subunit [Alteromonas sp. 5E99-2]|uniref:efflux transporter outer membrane subunit n=1 Tax=Alteromonas sp. 5E99-2 TaxID=2817683 RepID=UPI001A98637A|nr:efflux transporter outer membrane subunit [Alteromonas sp. 5E99-2]MBO1254821.1 efflux transporter outer membrane subunit [Alteromonas sp. 5E99-2]
MKHSRITTLLSVSIGLALTGCVNLAPEYSQPSAPIADKWPAEQANEGQEAKIDELEWREFYGDERLRQLIELALNNNRSLRQTVFAVESARAQFKITRANRVPSLDGTGSSTAQRSNGETSRSYNASIGISAFELDFFGRLRNLREQALETYLSNEESLRSIRITLVAEVASAYYTLAADQQRLRLAESTFESQQKSLDLTLRTFEIGTTSGLDVATASTSVDTARADIATYQIQVAQDLNALTLLVGLPIDPALVADAGIGITEPLAPLISAIGPINEAPSELLQRRPDVLAAERTLRAANANIGAARAARFPSITLTTSAGSSSSQLSDLFGGGTGIWSFIPSVSIPIFNDGALKADVRLAEAERNEALASYEYTIQTAFQEVSDALNEQENIQELVTARQSLVQANEKVYRLTDASFRKGLESSLSVLTAQREYNSAQLDMITTRLQEANNLVTLYRVLGGGWQL